MGFFLGGLVLSGWGFLCSYFTQLRLYDDSVHQAPTVSFPRWQFWLRSGIASVVLSLRFRRRLRLCRLEVSVIQAMAQPNRQLHSRFASMKPSGYFVRWVSKKHESRNGKGFAARIDGEGSR
jgi:hypothetical protein